MITALKGFQIDNEQRCDISYYKPAGPDIFDAFTIILFGLAAACRVHMGWERPMSIQQGTFERIVP
jgi:hypothetical protein